MASVWIRTRAGGSGLRFLVGYRLGGRGAREFHVATFTSRDAAEKLRGELRMKIAAAAIGTRPSDELVDRQELVYFATLGGLFKIGVSIAPERRARDLNAELLLVEPGGRRRERELHAAFATARVRGEWFRDDGRIRRYIESRACEPEDVNPHKEREQSVV